MAMDTVIETKKMDVNLLGSIDAVDAERMRNSHCSYIDHDMRNMSQDFSNGNNVCGDVIVALSILQKKAVRNDGGIVVTGLTGHIKNRFLLNLLDRMFEIR